MPPSRPMRSTLQTLRELTPGRGSRIATLGHWAAPMGPSARGPHAVGTMPRRRPRTSAPPLIGVVTHELREERAQAWAPLPGRSERDLAPARLALRLSYTQALQEAGAIAVVLPAHGYVDDTAALLDRVDGLLVSGGPDLDPALYGQEPHPLLGPDVDFVADEYEQALLRGAAARDAAPARAGALAESRGVRDGARRRGRAGLAAGLARRARRPRGQLLPRP